LTSESIRFSKVRSDLDRQVVIVLCVVSDLARRSGQLDPLSLLGVCALISAVTAPSAFSQKLPFLVGPAHDQIGVVFDRAILMSIPLGLSQSLARRRSATLSCQPRTEIETLRHKPYGSTCFGFKLPCFDV